ncbi:MAG TPA: hypothetical protein VL172_18135, partial [Kofleriaceae bacterium]|nr:hypothetical protein [Kofleriaceae bacterium]
MKRAALLLLIVVGGCPGERGPAAEPGQDDPRAAVAAAERLVAASLELDYAAPMQTHPGVAGRARAVNLYLSACRAGDKSSCWSAAYLRPPRLTSPERRAAVWQMARNCLGGADALSCRALTADEFRSFVFGRDRAIKACEAGLAAGCENAAEEEAMLSRGNRWQVQRPWLEHGCSLGDARCCARLGELAAGAGLSSLVVAEWKQRAADRARQECSAGYARSCQIELAGRPDPALTARMIELAEDGCRRGLIDECGLLADPVVADRALRIHGAGRDCAIAGVNCGALAQLHLDGPPRDPVKARDALETACQLHGDHC